MAREWAWIRNPNNWYWFVGADRTQVYSSMTGDFVTVADANYQTWLSETRTTPALVDTVDSLGIALSDLSAPPPVNVAVMDAYKSTQLSKIDTVMFKIMFNHENRIRALNSQPAITAQQFLAAIKALL